jgi:hypothetical protein
MISVANLVKEFEPETESHYTVPVEEFAPGVYLVQVQFDDTIIDKTYCRTIRRFHFNN